MKKSLRKLIPAIAMVLVAASMMGTATFAWFSMNNRVVVTGMKVTTKVDSNLLISATNADAASYANSLSQTRAALLEPASTINGIAFYYTSTSNVDAEGNAIAETYTAYSEATAWGSAHTDAGKTNYDTAFNSNYGFTSPSAGATTVAYGYIDYVFYLKGVNTSGGTADLNLTKLALTYNGAAVTDKAWRVALIAQTAAEYNALDTAPAAADVISIFTLSGATNFTANNAVSGASTVGALNYGSSVSTYNAAGTVVDDIANGATVYEKVTIRLWLEGEDKTCTNATYALLTGGYRLDIAFELASATSAVSNIGTPTASASGATGTATLAGVKGGTATTYQWYNASDDSAVSEATASTYTATTTGSYYCVITDDGKTYKTNSVTLTA